MVWRMKTSKDVKAWMKMIKNENQEIKKEIKKVKISENEMNDWNKERKIKEENKRQETRNESKRWIKYTGNK